MSIDRLSEYNRGILLRSFIVARAIPVFHAAEEMVADFAYRCIKENIRSFEDSLTNVPDEYLHVDTQIEFAGEHNTRFMNPIPTVVSEVRNLYTTKPHTQRAQRNWTHSLQRDNHPAAKSYFDLPFPMPRSKDGIDLPPSMYPESQLVENELEAIANKLRSQRNQLRDMLDGCSTFNQLWKLFKGDSPDRKLLKDMYNNFTNYRSAYALNADLLDKKEFQRLTIVGDKYKALHELLAETRPAVEMTDGQFKLTMRDEMGRTRHIPLMTTTRIED